MLVLCTPHIFILKKSFCCYVWILLAKILLNMCLFLQTFFVFDGQALTAEEVLFSNITSVLVYCFIGLLAAEWSTNLIVEIAKLLFRFAERTSNCLSKRFTSKRILKVK